VPSGVTDIGAIARVARAVDLSHAAGAQRRDDLVHAELRTGLHHFSVIPIAALLGMTGNLLTSSP